MKTKKKTFKEWRKNKGLRVEDIALKTGINFSTVARWDEGNVHPIDIIRRELAKHYPDCPLAAR